MKHFFTTSAIATAVALGLGTRVRHFQPDFGLKSALMA